MARSYQKTKANRKAVSRTPLVLLLLAVAALIAMDIAQETGLIGFDLGLTLFDDIALVALALFALKGYLQGIVITIFSMAGYLGGLVGGVLLSPALASLAMNRTRLGELLSEAGDKEGAMRRKDREKNDPVWLAETLTRADACHLALFDGAWPYVISLNYGFELAENGRLRLWFHCAREGKKLELLATNPHAAFIIDTGHGQQVPLGFG